MNVDAAMLDVTLTLVQNSVAALRVMCSQYETLLDIIAQSNIGPAVDVDGQTWRANARAVVASFDDAMETGLPMFNALRARVALARGTAVQGLERIN